jgi:hypothetical protein
VAASFTHNEGWGRVLVPLRDGTGWPLAAGVLLAALTMAYTGAGYSISRRKTGAAGIAAETTGALADPAPAPQLPTPAPPGAAALLALLAGGTAGVSLLLQAAANLAFQVPYSTDRTGLYYAVLVPVCVLSGSAALWRGGGIARWPAAPGIICACIASALYVVQLQVSHFRVWRYDADTRQILQQLRTILPAGSPPVALGGSWELEPSINFYQSARRWQWLQPFDRGAAGSGFPYYIFIPKDHDQIAQRSLQVIFRGPTSGTVLAAPERHTR